MQKQYSCQLCGCKIDLFNIDNVKGISEKGKKFYFCAKHDWDDLKQWIAETIDCKL